jgi:hypothetical protein
MEDVAFSGTVFHGSKPDPSRTCDGGVPDVTPFLKASLLKFHLGHDVGFQLMLSLLGV